MHQNNFSLQEPVITPPFSTFPSFSYLGQLISTKISMRKLILSVAGMLAVATSSFAQKGFNVGVHVTGGQVFSKNIAIPDDSPYYVKNNAGLMYGGGLDISYGFDDLTAIQTGINYVSRQFNLTPTDSLGNAYEELSSTKAVFSVPLLIRQRFPLNEKKSMYANVMVGQSLDIVKFDSTIFYGSATLAGQPYSFAEVVSPKKIIPTVLLGAGLDFQSASGNALNVSVVWGLSPYKMIKGDIKKYDALVTNFDPATDDDKQPDQFPSYYYDYAMRGSYLALQVHYWFNIKLKKKTMEEGEGEESSGSQD